LPDTRTARIVRRPENEKGWRNLGLIEGEVFADEEPSAEAQSLLSLIHISDLHICDAQSPARVELLDRYADPHNPISEFVKLVGTYRAQEIMTTQTLEAMVRAINQIDHGVLTTRPIDAVVITGDVTDNAQGNELAWYLAVLDGGVVHPDSGDHSLWEGVASTDPEKYDPSFWNPEGTPEGCTKDYPRALYGLPKVPGLTDAIRQPFKASGIKHRWLATHGNHDALLQGTVPANAELREYAVGSQRLAALAPDTNLGEMFSKFTMVGPTSYPEVQGASYTGLTADAQRNFNSLESWAELHNSCGHDHGLDQLNIANKSKYWYRDIDQIRLVSMDTVNINGGWQGSVDETQFEWIKALLCDQTPRYYIFLSHHPASTLFNLYAPDGAQRRVGEEELVNELLKDDRVILWLAGHNHEHKVEKIEGTNSRGFWHIQTASNIDWPQQGRIVEIVEEGTRIAIATAVFDHQGSIRDDYSQATITEPTELAGLSRALAGNDWQRRSGEFDLELMAGKPEDRNRILWL
jgi:metallophosphoesterase (TIGR03767 family)